MISNVIMVYCNFPAPSTDGDKAVDIARALVDDKLVACVNLIPQVRSIYSWQGQVCDDQETTAIMKTTSERFEALRARILELHPYELPEIIAVPLSAGHPEYLAWVRATAAAD
jgi:periplasmic divalent cation tolerance protein